MTQITRLIMILVFKLAITLTFIVAILPIAAMAASPPKDGTLIASLTTKDAWARLPQAVKGSGLPLPSWARILSGSLPKTTAALLELDLAQRTKSPLDPKLRAAMRWVAAHANQCKYGEAYAVFDARRAGLAEAAIEGLWAGDYSRWHAAERSALEFARKMTIESTKVSDDEFAFLVKSFGKKNAAAMVLLMAYANFQDRLLISLGAPLEERARCCRSRWRSSPTIFRAQEPGRAAGDSFAAQPTGNDLVADDPEWVSLTYEGLQSKLENQRSRSTRLPVPSWDELKSRGVAMKGTRVVWSLVVFGYVPELAAPWEAVMWVNGEENGRRFDRVFGLSLFWIVTRTIDCPYCMGHCEMNWEVIGMTPSQIAERSRALQVPTGHAFPRRNSGRWPSHAS